MQRLDLFGHNGLYSSIGATRRDSIGGGSLFLVDQGAREYADPPVDEFCIFLAKKGDCRVEFNLGFGARRCRLIPGLMVVAPPGTACEFKLNGPHSYYVVPLNQSWFGEKISDLGVLHKFEFFDPLVESAIATLWGEVDRGNPRSSLFADSVLNMLAQRLLHLNGRSSMKPRHSLLGKRGIANAITYIHENIRSSSITLDVLASVANMSKPYFCHIFSQEMSCSPYQYVIKQKIDEAKGMISNNPEISVGEIAESLGFSSASRMRSHFVRHVGMRPSEYRSKG